MQTQKKIRGFNRRVYLRHANGRSHNGESPGFETRSIHQQTRCLGAIEVDIYTRHTQYTQKLLLLLQGSP